MHECIRLKFDEIEARILVSILRWIRHWLYIVRTILCQGQIQGGVGIDPH